MTKASRNPKIDKNSRVFRYYEGKRAGRSKKESAIIAGYSPGVARSPQNIEKSQEYQLVENHFKGQLEGKITLGEIADALVDNIKQTGEDKIDRGARNQAIGLALERLEPKDAGESESVIVILK